MTQTLCELEKASGKLPHLLDAALQGEEPFMAVIHRC